MGQFNYGQLVFMWIEGSQNHSSRQPKKNVCLVGQKSSVSVPRAYWGPWESPWMKDMAKSSQEGVVAG